MVSFLLSSALLGYAASTVAQFVSPPTNLTSVVGAANITIRYKQVPAGICEQNASVKSYSGYADVAPDQHIFFWFFEARNVDPTTAPLTVWINGGPGSSSMIGLFQELGPCTINASGVAVDNPFSFSNVSNMIFIDQPTTTGFSYSIPVPGYTSSAGNIVTLPNSTVCPDYAADSCGTYSTSNVTLTANTTLNAAPNFYLTLQGFMGAFPQYSNNGFYFTTESYGGHYAPIFTRYLISQSRLNLPNHLSIIPRAVLIGNGWLDPILQYQAYYNFTVSPGNTYDLLPYNDSVTSQLYNNLYGPGNCLDQLYACNTSPSSSSSSNSTILNSTTPLSYTYNPTLCSVADTFCASEVESLFDNIALRDEYDSRELSPDLFPPSYFESYLNTPEIQSAIGAYVNFSSYSSTVGAAFSSTGDDAIVYDIPSVVADLVREENVSVVLYFGDADYNCNWLGGLAVLEVVEEGLGSDDFENGAGFQNITGVMGIVDEGGEEMGVPANGLVGEVRQVGMSVSSSSSSNGSGSRNGSVTGVGSKSFAFVRIFESGHEVPFYQPAGALEMFRRVVEGRDIATGTTKFANLAATEVYTTNGSLSSTYREGNGTVQYMVLDEADGWVYNVSSGMPSNVTSGMGVMRRQPGRTR